MSKNKVRFHAEMNIYEALKLDPAVEEAFKKMGLHCGECVASEVETLRQAALYHEKDLDALLRDLNRLKIKPS